MTSESIVTFPGQFGFCCSSKQNSKEVSRALSHIFSYQWGSRGLLWIRWGGQSVRICYRRPQESRRSRCMDKFWSVKDIDQCMIREGQVSIQELTSPTIWRELCLSAISWGMLPVIGGKMGNNLWGVHQGQDKVKYGQLCEAGESCSSGGINHGTKKVLFNPLLYGVLIFFFSQSWTIDFSCNKCNKWKEKSFPYKETVLVLCRFLAGNRV